MDALISPRRRAILQAGGAAALLASCGDPRGAMAIPGLHVFHGLSMGTTYTVKLYAPGAAESRIAIARDRVAAELERIVAKMSTYDATSELGRFNRHRATTPFAMSSDTLRVFDIACDVSEASGGAFDVTVAPSVDAWGFGPDKHCYVPPEDVTRAARSSIGFRGVTIDRVSQTIAKRSADIRADLSGIAKGYGVDVASRALDALGFDRYLMEIAGEIRTKGANADGRAWQIAIERPDAVPQRAYRIVPIADRAISTSGDYRIYFEQDGRRYCHEIDPTTGAPIAHSLASVSVVAAESARADAWATALFVLGPDRGYALAATHGLAAHFIVRDRGGFVERSTPAFASLGSRSA